MPSTKILTSDAKMAFISVTLIAIALVLWWTITIVSVLILLGVLIYWVGWTWRKIHERITQMFYRPHKPRRIIFRRGNENLMEFEARIRKAIFDELEEEEFDNSSYSRLSLSDLDESIPIHIIQGLRKDCATRLEKNEILDMEDLAEASEDEVIRICGVDKKVAQTWIADAIALTYGAGITSILDLSIADASDLFEDILQAEKVEDINFPKDYSIDIDRIQWWIDAANKETSSIDYEEVRRWLDKHEG